MAVCTYNRGADTIMERALSTTALDLRCALVLGNVTGLINVDLNTVADVDGLNAGATNLHTERVALTSETSTQDDTNNRANVDSADIVFAPAAGVTALGAVIYDEGSATDATRNLVWGMTFAAGQPVDGGLTLTVTDFLRVATATA